MIAAQTSTSASAGASGSALGVHPWLDEQGHASATRAGIWMANIILMAGGSATTAFYCAHEVAKDIESNPSKFK